MGNKKDKSIIQKALENKYEKNIQMEHLHIR